MADIFLSYARKDSNKAQLLASALENQGWTVFWDQIALRGGQDFEKEIQQAIQQADCMIVAWSATSVESDWVRGEADIGRKRKILVPALFEPVEPPIAFRTLHTENLIDWNGDANAQDFLKLCKAINAYVKPEIREDINLATSSKVELKHKDKPEIPLTDKESAEQQIKPETNEDKTGEHPKIKSAAVRENFRVKLKKTHAMLLMLVSITLTLVFIRPKAVIDWFKPTVPESTLPTATTQVVGSTYKQPEQPKTEKADEVKPLQTIQAKEVKKTAEQQPGKASPSSRLTKDNKTFTKQTYPRIPPIKGKTTPAKAMGSKNVLSKPVIKQIPTKHKEITPLNLPKGQLHE